MCRIRTGYSFNTAIGHLNEVATALKKTSLESWPITDRTSTFGFNRWAKICQENKKKPVFGVELAVTLELGNKKPIVDWWTFLAIKDIKKLNELVELATSNPGKFPMLLYHQAISAKGIIKITGNLFPDILTESCKASDIFVGISPSIPMNVFNKANNVGARFIAQMDNVYVNEDDRELYRMTLGIRSSVQSYPQHIINDKEWHNSIKRFVPKKIRDKALSNRNDILTKCNVTLKKAKLLIPKKPKTLRTMCIAGAKDLKIDLKDKVYKDRLSYELKLIKDKDYEDYFYIISDMVSWAKKRMVVGPGRGSSSGSLVCFLLGITSIDPIQYGLIFERFIDINRSDLPDIDIDFSDIRRNLVFEYAEKKYGETKIARLGTVGMYKPRSALNTIGAALRVPKWRIEKVQEGIVTRFEGDDRASQIVEDTLKETDAGKNLVSDFPHIIDAGKLEGHPRNASQHAAGIVITQNPVVDIVAIDSRTQSAMCDKKDAEDYNLLKIDALGLTQLSIFEGTMDRLNIPSISGWLEQLPLNDPKAFQVLNDGHFSGIFQFNGMALQGLARQITFDCLEDFIAITALARPGPLANSDVWVKRKMNKSTHSLDHPILKEITKETYGIILYQEQVMKIAKEIGNFSWSDVSILRKAISKSLGSDVIKRFKKMFIEGASENGIDQEIAGSIWDKINTFGRYAFNRSHSVAYGIISYWCCWFKAYHPLEFAAATLDAENDPVKQIKILRELEKEGVGYKPFDIETSEDKWTIIKNKNNLQLVGPLSNIKGVGPKTVKEILLSRENGEPLRESLAKRLNEAHTSIDTLYPVATATQILCPDLASINIVSTPKPIETVQCGIEGDIMIIAVVNKINIKDENDDISVERRGYKVNGPIKALNMFFYDDTDEIFCKIDRYKFAKMAQKIIDTGKVGKSIYAVKGSVPKNFRMITVESMRYIGELNAI